MFSAGVFLALIFVIAAAVRWVSRWGYRAPTRYRLEHVEDTFVLAEHDPSASASDGESPIEVWQALYALTAHSQRVYSHVFLPFEHDLEVVVHPKRSPEGGILDRLQRLARPLGFTPRLALGFPDIDERLHIHVPRDDRSARGRLRTQEFRRLLERVAAEPDLLALYLFPRNVRHRQAVFGRGFVRAVGSRSGILVLFDCALKDLDLERLGTIASAALLCREVRG